MPAQKKYIRQLSVPITQEDRVKLDYHAAKLHINTATLVRMAVRELIERLTRESEN